MKFKFFTCLSFSMVFLSYGYAEDYSTWNLPEGATMRIGKGRETLYSLKTEWPWEK